jgi:CRP-like cAMP-binding protein
MQLSSVVGTPGATPGGMGGNTIGLGIVLKLHDAFSKQAVRADRQMQMLSNRTDKFVQRMDQGLHAMSAGLGTMAVGAGALAVLAFPLRDAINFQESIQQTFSIMDEKTPEMREKLERLAIDLGSTLPGTAEEMSRALKSAITAGITDLDTAGYIVEFGTKH